MAAFHFKTQKRYYGTLGGASLLIGLYLCYDSIYRPLHLAFDHASDIHYSVRAFFFGPPCLILGLVVTGMALLMKEERLASLVKRPPFVKEIPPPGTRKQVLRVLALLLFVFGPVLLLYWWFKTKMAALGYDVDF